MRTFLQNFLISSILWISLLQTQAHSVYFEPQENGDLVIRFAEFGDDYEESPGFLDYLDHLTAWNIGEAAEPTAIDPKKQKQGFFLDIKSTDVVCADTGFPVTTRGSSPARKPYFYARWVSDFTQKARPSMTLDLVPTGKQGEVQAFFRNKPLAGVEVSLFTPNLNDEVYKADENGIIQFKTNPEEKGLYMLKIERYREELPGFDRGVAYVLTSHNCSITFKQ